MSTTDCEKFEPLLLDELYGELDELTSKALERHVTGCARCKSSLDGMRATRSLVSPLMVDVPAGLEDRILAAAKEAQKVVPIRSRFSRALSAAGSWAMRPQTAMAAVFLLMVGSSAFLLRKQTRSADSAAVSVTVAGSPQAVASVASESDRLDDKSAANAHGPITLPPATATAAAAPAGQVAAADEDGTVDKLTGAAREKAKDDNALGALANGENQKNEAEAKKAAAITADPSNAYGGPNVGNAYGSRSMNAGPAAGAPAQGAGGGDGFAQQQAAPLTAQKRGGGPNDAQDPFSLGTAAYRARNYAEATKQFDQAAQSGDQNAALWAARATKDGQGCTAAVSRFEGVERTSSNAWQQNEASLEIAKCQIAMGQLDAARARLTKLQQVASHKVAANQQMAELDAVASRRAGTQSGGSHASPKAVTAPNRAPAPKPAAKSDTAAGF
jgi:hypothetical protein